MRRITPFILLILLPGTLAVHGQFIESMGVKAGITIANQSHQISSTNLEYTLETEPIGGPAIAIFFEAFRKKHQSIQLDLAYALKGCQSAVHSVTVNHLDNDRIIVNEGDTYESKFHYLSLAPLGRFRMEWEHLGLYGLIGPRLDLLLKYQTESEYPLEEQNRIILGINVGAGLEFGLEKMAIFTEVQFQPDISTVTNKDPLHINNNILFITIGIRYFNQ